MNGLSLRVSSIKTSQNLKKNSEIQISILKLPDKYLTANAENSDMQLCLTEFSNGKSIEHQLAAVKKLFTVMENDPSPDVCKRILGILSEIYFLAPLKHPIRNTIARNFERLKLHRNLAVESLVQAVTHNLAKINESSSVYEINYMITSLEGCTENFQIGVLALNCCFDDIFQIIVLSTTKCLMEIKKPNSPANLNEILIFFHGSIRLSLWYVQRCVTNRTLDRTTELAYLSTICQNIIESGTIPLDTKLNCGIFVVLHEIIKDNLCALTDHLVRMTEDSNFKNDSVSILCYCYGLCNTLASSQILSENGSVLVDLMKRLRHMADLHTNDQTILLGVCRALSQMTKAFLTIDSIDNHTNDANEENSFVYNLIPQCLSFVWAYFEHHLDTVRHFCNEIFKNLLKLSNRFDEKYAFIRSIILSNLMNQEISQNAQYVAIEYLCQDMRVEEIIESWPTIFDDLFTDLEDSKCLSCYQKLMTMHFKETDVDSWYQLWIQPLLYNSTNSIDLQVKESLVNAAIKTHPLVAGYFLQERNKLPIELYLFVVSTIRRNGLKVGMTFVADEDELICAAKFHKTDEIRIMHLRIFVEVHKTTHPFTCGDLNEILGFLFYNSNCQSPSFRQKIVAFMTKAFNRIEASYPSVLKDPTTEVLNSYIGFLTNVKNLCVSNIFTGANFSRRSISLHLLLQTVSISSKNDKISPQDLWTSEFFEKLIKSLSDTYEANKILAVDIIRLCPKHLIPITNMLDLQYLKSLVTSVKPTDCVTAAYSLEYCCISGLHFSSYFEAIKWCEQILTEGLKVAQSSLLIAARMNPLYGLIYCIRHLMDKVDLRTTFDQPWRNFVKGFIDLCKDLTKVVGPIVNSESPEGHLPNDFSNVKQFLPNDPDSTRPDGPPNKILSPRQNECNENFTTTPQMLLLCSWRTVKEVSLVLGNLTLNASIANDVSHGLITVNEILEIANHFHVLLSETKHRGAFEQAFVGFSKLCVRLWRAQESCLHQLPMIWLKDLLNIISGNEDSLVTNIKFDKICATRRSAGVPFMIQAIITSELQVCTNNGLKYAMGTLIEVCKTDTVVEAKTHALNILRALFRCTDLGDSVGEYISDGFECAIRGYSSNSWPERNSSTLLFSSLITRVFGVQRTKDSENLNIRNKMTGRIFFLKYPRLFDFFFVELQSASSSIRKDELPSILHPLLILLSRLYPSSVEGCESNLKLSSFLPLIAQCTCSPELGTRKLAVKSIVALVPQYQIYDYVHNVVQLMQMQMQNSNATHGCLLQIYHLIKSINQKLFMKQIKDFLSLLEKYLNLNVVSNNNFVLIKVYLDTLIEVFRRIGSQKIAKFELNNVRKLLTNILSAQNNFIGFPLAVKSSLVCHLMLNADRIENLYFIENLPQQQYEYVDTALNIILLVLCHDNEVSILDQFEFESNELHLEKYLSNEQKNSLQHMIIKSQKIIFYLNEIIKNEPKFYPYCTIKAYTILSKLTVEFTSVDALMEILDSRFIDQIDDVKTSILRYVGQHLIQFFPHMNEVNLVKILKQLREMADADCADVLRSTVSYILTEIRREWTSVTSLILFSDIVLLLLRDECSDIREQISEFVQCLLSGHETMPILPSLAEEQFIDWLNVQFRIINPEKSWNAWVQLIEMQMVKDPNGIEEVIEEVFDKCEANMFGEIILVCKKMYRKLEENLRGSDGSVEQIQNTLSSFKIDWPELFSEILFVL